jgi:hypothetical protein
LEKQLYKFSFHPVHLLGASELILGEAGVSMKTTRSGGEQQKAGSIDALVADGSAQQQRLKI